MTRLVLIGAGGHGKVAADTAETLGWSDVVFLDDVYPERKTNGKWPIIGGIGLAASLRNEGADVFISIGSNRQRSLVANEMGGRFATLIHPRAHVSPYAQIAEGTLIVAGAVVNTYARIGQGTIINTGATVDHDCKIDSFVHVSPGAHIAGEVKVGTRSWIGIGASVRECIEISRDVRVGAGACVVSDVAAGRTVVGVPARELI